MRYRLSSDVLDSDFVREMARRSRQNVLNCYQCGKCSAGCPINFKMDHQPSEIMRMVQLGMKEAVLHSKTIWLCISCETCTTRCPRENAPSQVMDALRSIYSEEYEKKEIGDRSFFRRLWHNGLKEAMGLGTKWDIRAFNSVFLENVRRHGRAFEISLIGGFNAGSGYLFRNVLKGPVLLLKGKMGFFPRKIDRTAQVRKIARKIEEMEDTKL